MRHGNFLDGGDHRVHTGGACATGGGSSTGSTRAQEEIGTGRSSHQHDGATGSDTSDLQGGQVVVTAAAAEVDVSIEPLGGDGDAVSDGVSINRLAVGPKSGVFGLGGAGGLVVVVHHGVLVLQGGDAVLEAVVVLEGLELHDVAAALRGRVVLTVEMRNQEEK